MPVFEAGADVKGLDPDKPRCMACFQAESPVVPAAGRAKRHSWCPGWFGGYGGLDYRRCECGCPTSKRHRETE